MLRRFIIERDVDINGKSGTGPVAEGVEFENGWIAYTWLSPKATVTVSNSISVAEFLHSHGGDSSNARIVWIDEVSEDIEEKAEKIKTKKIKELKGEEPGQEEESEPEETEEIEEGAKEDGSTD